MRDDIEFNAEGVTLRGWLYTPDRATGPSPTIVMAHGFSAVKEMYLDRYAEVFANAGMAVLVFDNRNFGSSDGEPRQEIDPWAQVRDYRHAITYASTRSEVDPTRIGIWGSSYSGGHVLVVGAIDRRVRCVVAQVPLVSGHANAQRLIRSDFLPAFQAQFNADRDARFRGEPQRWSRSSTPTHWLRRRCPPRTPSSGSRRRPSSARPPGETRSRFAASRCSLEYEPGTYLPWISPTPLLMCVAADDVLTVSDLAIDGFERAREPKRLVIMPGGHFDAYVDGFDVSSGAAVDWFVQHLLVQETVPA